MVIIMRFLVQIDIIHYEIESGVFHENFRWIFPMNDGKNRQSPSN